MRKLIDDTYQETVALSSCPQELKVSLKFKERVPTLISNLEIELKKLPVKYQTKGKIQETVISFTNIFLNAMERKAKEDLLTHAAKAEIKNQADLKQKADSLVDDMSKGKEIDAERIEELIK